MVRSIQAVLTISVYISFVLYGLHNQSRLLNQYISKLDQEQQSRQQNDETSSFSPPLLSTEIIQNINNTNSSSSSLLVQKLRNVRREKASVHIQKSTVFDDRSNKLFHHHLSSKTKNATKNYNQERWTKQDKTNITSSNVEASRRARPYFDYSTTSQTLTGGTIPPPYRKWAYAFLVGGCDPQTKPQYRGFIYNVVVAVQRLQELGSQAEFVLFVQMSHNVTTNDGEQQHLPEEDIRLLDTVGVRIIYLPKFISKVHETFYALVMEKFRILQLIEYSRVLFLDSDIMPLCNLDYLFELSDPNNDGNNKTNDNNTFRLKENIVMGWSKEPANAGLFMLKPNLQDYELLQQVILKKEKQALALPWPHWDPIQGWGHIIEESDAWKSPDGKTGTNWTWHASFADQGLLYYWVKYVQKSVSLIIGDTIENWGQSNDGSAILETTYQDGGLDSYTCRPLLKKKKRHNSKSFPPYRDFKHFTGKFFMYAEHSAAKCPFLTHALKININFLLLQGGPNLGRDGMNLLSLKA